jgi:hypothetical protein
VREKSSKIAAFASNLRPFRGEICYNLSFSEYVFGRYLLKDIFYLADIQ